MVHIIGKYLLTPIKSSRFGRTVKKTVSRRKYNDFDLEHFVSLWLEMGLWMSI